jgi:hypothetical protein
VPDAHEQIDSPLDPYAAIVELAERELALARDGRLDGLAALAGEWGELTAALPSRPPLAARGALERAAGLHEQAHEALMGLREAMLCEVRASARASRAAHGYASVARRPLRRLDRSA